MPTDLPSPFSRTPEQHAAVRRRATTLALCGAFCGIVALAIMVAKAITADHPPAIFAVNFAFCALMMGIGIIFYARGTSHTRVAVGASVVAIVTGIAGTLVYVRQTTQWRARIEARELANVAAIAHGALHYARQHTRNYPPDLTAMLLAGDISLENIHSPTGMAPPIDLYHMDVEIHALKSYALIESVAPVNLSAFRNFVLPRLTQEVEADSDYQYLGQGLRLPADPNQKLPNQILLAASVNTVLGRQVIAVSYADGKADFLEQSGAESAILASNDARNSLGFPVIRPPKVIVNVEQEDRKTSPAADP